MPILVSQKQKRRFARSKMPFLSLKNSTKPNLASICRTNSQSAVLSLQACCLGLPFFARSLFSSSHTIVVLSLQIEQSDCRNTEYAFNLFGCRFVQRSFTLYQFIQMRPLHTNHDCKILLGNCSFFQLVPQDATRMCCFPRCHVFISCCHSGLHLILSTLSPIRSRFL